MRVSSKSLCVLLTAILIAGAFLGWLTLHQPIGVPLHAKMAWANQGEEDKPLPPSDKTTAEIEEMIKDRGPKDNDRKRPGTDELLAKVAKQKDGKEKIEKAKAKKPGTLIEASDKTPTEIQETIKDRGPKDNDRKRPGTDELLAKVAKQKGGKEKIDKAKKKGTKTGMAPSEMGIAGRLLPHLNPFMVQAAKAQTQTYNLRSSWHRTLTTDKPYDPFDGYENRAQTYICIWGARRGISNNRTWREYLSNNGRIDLWVNVPSTGYYLVNFEVCPGVSAKLQSHGRAIQTWDTRGKTGWVDHPAFVYLAQGTHVLSFSTDATYWYIYRVTIEKPY